MFGTSVPLQAQESWGTKNNPILFNTAEFKDLAMLFEVLGPVNGSVPYEIKTLDNVEVSPFTIQRYLRDIESYIQRNSGQLASVLARYGDIFVTVAGVPMSAASYDFDRRAYRICFPNIGNIIGWLGSEDGNYYMQARGGSTSLLDLTTANYHTDDMRYDGNKQCPGLSRDAFPSRFYNGGQLGGKFRESLLIPMSEDTAENLYLATRPNGEASDPIIMFGSITCKIRRGYCTVDSFEVILPQRNEEFNYFLSWARNSAFRMEQELRD